MKNDIIRVRDSITRPGDTDQYAIGDAISAVTTNNHHEFAGVGRRGQMAGIIRTASVMTTANSATKPDLVISIFHTDVTEAADNAAFSPTNAHLLTLIAAIDVPTTAWLAVDAAADGNGNAIACIGNLNIYYRLPDSNAGTLYAQLSLQNTYTPIASQVFTTELVIERLPT